MDSRTAYEVGTGQTRPRSNGTEITTIIGAVLRAMGATLKNLFRKPITVHYPDKERQYPSRYRGLLALTYDKETGEENCIGCRLCEYVCPPAVIKAQRSVLPKDLPILAVGGVKADSVGPWLQAGADGFGLGSGLYKGGESGAGSLESHGKIEWREGLPYGDIRLDGENLRLVDVPEARIDASPDLDFRIAVYIRGGGDG